jgi:ABC-type Co2+ transport system permease subunit
LGKSGSSHTLALPFGSVLGRRAAGILVGMWDAVLAHAVVVLVRSLLAAHFAVWVLLKCGFRFSWYRIYDCKYLRSG